jgi:hypothetical protein
MNLLKMYPVAELGVQAQPSAMSFGLRRNIWFDLILHSASVARVPVNVAVHVNYEWCDDLCSGKIPYEIKNWMNRFNIYNNAPVVRRWQLNIGDGTRNFDTVAIAKLIREHPRNEFIFPYNDGVKDKIDALYKTGIKFSLLYDSSYGYGVSPEKWEVPVYEDIPMGYAGGLSPENVIDNLNKINAQVPKNYTTWIDAEGRLMKPGTRELDLERAHAYIQNALAWQYKQNKR